MTRFDWMAAAPGPRDQETESARDILAARLAYLAEAGGSEGFETCPSPREALDRVRARCSDAHRPRRLIGCGGDDTRLVSALTELAMERGDTLVLAPPVSSGAPAAESLWLATEPRPGEPPPLLVLGAATQTGLLGPLADVLDLVDERRIEVLLDLSAAPWAVLDELDAFRPLGVVAALDRWDGQPAGTWGALALPADAPDCEPGLPPEPPSGTPAHIYEIDAWLRGVLSARGAFKIWPRGSAGVSPGVICFEIEGCSAIEARTMLERSFGVLIDAGPLAAVPLPPPPGLSGQPMRIALHPDHDERCVEPLVQGLLRLSETPESVPTLH